MSKLLGGHGHLCNRGCNIQLVSSSSSSSELSRSHLFGGMQETALHQSLLVQRAFRARVSPHSRRQHGMARVPHPLIRAAQSSSDPHPPPSPASQISEDDKLDGDKRNAKKGSKESIMIKLRRYGVAGMLSYGLLNTVYYLGTFLFAWFYISPAPSGLGYRAAAERFIKLFALVWAGSQVTKLLRAGCALALAPAIDRGLTWLTDHSRFQSQAEVFGVIVFSCFGLALAVFLVITCLWA